jgi:hypothetical protein
MALDNALKFANRCGLNMKIYKYPKTEGGTFVEVDFANECALDISGDITWANGGQYGSKLVGFPNPIEGTFKISTQIMTKKLLTLITGADATADATEYVFKNEFSAETIYYVIEADTVWKNAEGKTEAEAITVHKALPKRAYNIVYNGSGDPVSVDIEFELLADGVEQKVVTIKPEATA